MEKKKDFSEKYLNGSEDFSKLTTITSGDEDQFVVVPKGKKIQKLKFGHTKLQKLEKL